METLVDSTRFVMKLAVYSRKKNQTKSGILLLFFGRVCLRKFVVERKMEGNTGRQKKIANAFATVH